MLSSDEIKKKVDHISSEIHSLKENLLVIQEACAHSEHHIGPIDHSAQSTVMLICNYCDKRLGYPSKKQMMSTGYFFYLNSDDKR